MQESKGIAAVRVRDRLKIDLAHAFEMTYVKRILGQCIMSSKNSEKWCVSTLDVMGTFFTAASSMYA